ncbi:MAG: PDZ domain-containing protein [Tepidisphaeraceae bacterium]|jgi:S1-C subfamily serine protease
MSETVFKPSCRARGAAVGICALLLILFPPPSPAQSADLPTSRPLLDELNHETQTLFKQIAPSIVRVQLPMPTNLSVSPDDPLAKWANRLDPVSLARLEEIERGSPGTPYLTAEIHPTTIPSSTQPVVQQAPHVIVLRLDRFSPNGIGVVLDDQNRLLIPRYVDQAACQFPIPVSIGDGRWATASFLASDRQADLTLLRINGKVKTKSAMISADAPQAGTLLLVMSLNPAGNRLAVWEGWEPDVSTLVNIDGSIAGFTKGGHFLSAAACAPVVSELIEHGVVRRALLGVVIATVPPDDPERQLNPALGATPALRISHIIPGSPAERAGLQPDDLILKLAGESVGDAPTFAAAIANRRGNTRIDVLRKGQLHVVNVVLQVE